MTGIPVQALAMRMVGMAVWGSPVQLSWGRPHHAEEVVDPAVAGVEQDGPGHRPGHTRDHERQHVDDPEHRHTPYGPGQQEGDAQAEDHLDDDARPGVDDGVVYGDVDLAVVQDVVVVDQSRPLEGRQHRRVVGEREVDTYKQRHGDDDGDDSQRGDGGEDVKPLVRPLPEVGPLSAGRVPVRGQHRDAEGPGIGHGLGVALTGHLTDHGRKGA